MITLSTFLSVLVINLYMRGDRRNRVPKLLRKVAQFWIFLYRIHIGRYFYAFMQVVVEWTARSLCMQSEVLLTLKKAREQKQQTRRVPRGGRFYDAYKSRIRMSSAAPMMPTIVGSPVQSPHRSTSSHVCKSEIIDYLLVVLAKSQITC